MPLNKISLSLRTLLLPAMLITGLSACGGSSGSDDGYVSFYNASPNSPAIFLTLDEDLDDNGTDEFERTYSSVEFAETTGNIAINPDRYTIELAFQDDDDSNDRDDLNMIYTNDLRVTKDDISFVVLSGDISDPVVFTYDVELLDEDDDVDDELFNMRILNMHPSIETVDVYLAEDDDPFSSADLLGSFTFSELSENMKFDQDDYTFYITLNGSTEVVFTSDEIAYDFPSQYVMVVRENQGVGVSPFTLDRVSGASSIEFPDDVSQARFKIFNSIEVDREIEAEEYNEELLANYTGVVDVEVQRNVDALSDEAFEFELTGLAQGEFTESQLVDRGDYRVSLKIPGTDEFIAENRLLSLGENVDSSVFFYLAEEEIDDDNDNDVDENRDGVVDEIEVTIESLIVTNSTVNSVIDTEINIINLVDDEDFDAVTFFFVLDDERTGTADNVETARFAIPSSIRLLNNQNGSSYTIQAIAVINDSVETLVIQELTLDADSVDQFLLFEEDATSATGYRITLQNQGE